MWAADAIAPASMHILCIAPRYNKPNKPENHKKYPIYYVSSIKLEQQDFDILNYKIFKTNLKSHKNFNIQ